jgi:hypothetical protein
VGTRNQEFFSGPGEVIDVDASQLIDDEAPSRHSFGHDEVLVALNDVEMAAFPGELVLFRALTSTVHLLGSVAGATWLCLDGSIPVGALSSEVAEATGLADGAELAGQIEVALDELHRAGLLQGSEIGFAPLMPDVLHAGDNTEVLAPPFILHDDPLDEVAWAGTATVRLARGNLLVRIRVDDAAVLSRVRALLEPWLEPAEVDDPELVSMFSVLCGDSDTQHRTRPRRLAELRAGPTMVERSADIGVVVASLAGVLNSIDVQRGHPERIWLGMRACVSNEHVVLVDALPPVLTSARALAAAGLWSPPTWVVEVVEPDVVRVPAAPPALGWYRTGLTPPPTVPEATLKGCVVVAEAFLGPLDTPGQLLTHLASRSPNPAWFRVACSMVDQGRVRVVRGDRSDPALQRAVLGVLDAP